MDRIHVFLNAERGLSVLQALAAAGHGIGAVHVPRAAAAKPALAEAARELAVKLEAVDDTNTPDFVAAYGARRPRLAVVAGFSTIFKPPLVAAPELGTINCHAGRLPQYRGGSPLNWQIINGEAMAGISVIRMDGGIDSGDVLAETSIPIAAEDDIATLHDKANARFPELVVEVVRRFERGNLSGRRQDPAAAVYWHQRNDDDGHIDFGRATARRVHDQVRALTSPYPGAFAYLGDRRMRILKTALDAPDMRGVPGRIVHIQGQGPFAICADRALRLVSWRFEDNGSPRLATGARLR